MKVITFLDYYVDRIRSGRKTQTRRPVKPQPRPDRRETLCSPYGEAGDTLDADEITLRITGVRLENLKEISDADIHAEGFGSREDFIGAWDMIYQAFNLGWKTDPFVWVYEFEPIPQPPTE